MSVRTRIDEAVYRLRGVFLEVPGTHVSAAQAARLSGLDEALCKSVLAALEDTRFLKRTGDGRYRHRSADSPLS
jgi:DNA-binding IclR family transcriptional regulator